MYFILHGISFLRPNIEIRLTDSQLLALVVATPILAAAYLAFKLPPPPAKLVIHPSLAALPGPETTASKRLKELYPEDIFPNPHYAALPFGKLKYNIVGPELGPKLVLICGISVPSVVWTEVVPRLKQDFRILMFDHYGRGYSEGPEVKYDAMFYVTEVALLMQYVGWDKANIVGYSMGGGVAVALVAACPHLVNGKVALIAPAGLLSGAEYPLAATLLTTPLAQSVLASSFVRSIASKMHKPEDYPSKVEELMRLQQLVLPAHLPALASTARIGPLRGQQDAYSTLGASDVEVVVIWGTADKIVPYSLAAECLTRVPKAMLITVEDAGHEIVGTHSVVVGEALYEFFKQ